MRLCGLLGISCVALSIIPPSLSHAAGGKRGAKKEVPPLFRVIVNGKCGFMNDKGGIVIQPAYRYAGDFSDGLARVRADSYGYIDPTGKMVIEPKFAMAYGFSEGLAWVGTGGRFERFSGRFMDGKYGVINKKGGFAIAPSFECLGTPFFRGLAIVETSRNSSDWAFIDRSGRMLRKRQFSEIRPFKDNMARYAISRVTDGEMVGQMAFATELTDFYGFLDHTYAAAIVPKFERASEFSEGLASAKLKHGKFGFINKRGRFVVKPTFRWAEPFSEGLAAVVLEEEEIGEDFAVPIKWGYIDRRVKLAFEPVSVCFAGPFSDGRAVLYLSTKKDDEEDDSRAGPLVVALGTGGLKSRYGPHRMRVIDKEGKAVFEKKHCFVESFKNGLARVHDFSAGQLKVKIGYIDGTGAYVWEPRN